MLADHVTALGARINMRAYANRMRTTADALLSNLTRDQLASALMHFRLGRPPRTWQAALLSC